MRSSIAVDWPLVRLCEIADLQRGKFTARPRTDPRFFGGPFPFIQTGDVPKSGGVISSYSQTLNDQGLSVSKLFPANTLFFTIAANIADVGIARFATACPDSLVAISPRATVDKRWLLYALGFRKKHFESIATQNAQLNINLEKLRPYELQVPCLAEQQAIAQALSDVDDLIQSLERLVAKKRGLKQATMQQLLTGQTRLPGFSGKWPERSFADLFVFSGGFSASREQLSHMGHCYLHYGDIHTTARTCIDLRTDADSIPRLNVALGQVAPASLLADGDVVFVDASEDVDGTSRHVVVANPEGIPFISGLHTIVAKGKDRSLDREYKRFCFQAEAIKRQFRFYAVGTKVSGVSKTNIARMSIHVPSLPEQKAIAEVLSDMDAEIAALEARLRKTRDLKQGMMQELLTGRTRLV